jgi:sensor histidine kinase YesM
MTSDYAFENKRAFRILSHFCAWVVYGTFIFFANYISDPKLTIGDTILFIVPYCGTFYLSLYCLNLYKRIGVLWSIASFVIVFLVMSFIGYCYIYLILPLVNVKLYSSYDFRDFLKSAALGYVQYFSYALLYFYVVQWMRKQRELRRVQEEKLTKELENSRLKQQELKSQKDKLLLECAFLRSQINPHFLHNTLNMLFGQAMEYSQELADSIASLSKIMRYSMESVEYDSDKVSVQRELDHLRLLIEINNLRFDHSKRIDYSIEGVVSDQMLPPLSMITVVENAFKYGDLKDPRYPLKIKVILHPGQVYFFCRNKKKKNNFELSSHNIGITNLEKRLDVAFNGKYQIKTTDQDDLYTFELLVNT